MPEKLQFDIVYRTYKLLYMNPDTDDVLSFLYVYEQVQSGRDLNEIRDEIEKNQEETGYAYPNGYRQSRENQ